MVRRGGWRGAAWRLQWECDMCFMACRAYYMSFISDNMLCLLYEFHSDNMLCLLNELYSVNTMC